MSRVSVQLKEVKSGVRNGLPGAVEDACLAAVARGLPPVTGGAGGGSTGRATPQADLGSPVACAEPRADAVAALAPARAGTELPVALPLGQLTLLLGNPGVGKSLVALDLAARLSRMQRSAIVLSLEDTRDTLKTRLAAAGAFTKHIYLPPPEQRRDDLSLVPQRPIGPRFGGSADDPSPLVDWLMIGLSDIPNPGLLVLDPLPAFFGRHDSNSQGAIRAMLTPLLEVAGEFKMAVVGITHMNKSVKSNNPLHRAIGSLAYTALARTIYLVDYHTRWRINGRRPSALAQMPRLIIPLKNNLAPITHATAFDITDKGAIRWHEAPVKDHPLLSPPETADDPLPQSELDFACEFLSVTLADGPIPSSKLLHLAREQGIAKRTYDRARTELGIRPFHELGSSNWMASLPGGAAVSGSVAGGDLVSKEMMMGEYAAVKTAG